MVVYWYRMGFLQLVTSNTAFNIHFFGYAHAINEFELARDFLYL